jgi:site-specific recombinase XerD
MVLGLRMKNSFTRRFATATLGEHTGELCSAFCNGATIVNARLQEVSPADVGIYLDELTLSVASKKQILAGLRHFFDGMVTRHAIALNPALSVRGERYQVMEGKTPEITIKQARKLLSSINTDNVVGLRDKAIMSILIYTASPSWRGGSAETQRPVRHRRSVLPALPRQRRQVPRNPSAA